ncbi:MAG: hypothetical protein IKM61_07680 [Eubacteriaceae bacterium]|nr:hypothetical protein [Eubacteriaceae bacterium]
MNIVQIALIVGIILGPVVIISAVKKQKKKNSACDGNCKSCNKIGCE